MNILNKIGADGKTRNVLFNTFAAFGVKGLALVVHIFTMPIYMRYFSDQQVLGVWYTVLSVLTWILSFDFGIGNGLRNQLTDALTHEDKLRIRKLISSSYFLIGAVVVILMIAGVAIIPFANWNMFFNIDKNLISAETLQAVVRYAFIGIALQFFFRLINSVLYALQKSAINNLLALISSVLQFSYALLAPVESADENLRRFAFAYLICSNIPLVITTVIVFLGKMRFFRPSLQYFEWSCAKGILSLGGIFFLCQVMYMIIVNTNEFFISAYTDPANVVPYQIYYKLFSLGSSLYMIGLTPIWSAVSRAVAEKDSLWLQRLNRTICKFSIVACICEFALILPLQWIINFWLGEEAIQVNYAYALCFALFGASMIFQSGVSTIVCGVGKMKAQAICYVVAVAIKLISIYFLLPATGSWIIVVLVNALILIPYCIIEQINLNRYFKQVGFEKQE